MQLCCSASRSISVWPSVAGGAPIPSILVAGFYLGLLTGWWGNGVGDAWFVPMFLGFLIATASAWAGIATRRGLDQRLTSQRQ